MKNYTITLNIEWAIYTLCFFVMSHLTEEDVKLKLITPAIQEAGWDTKVKWQVRCEQSYTKWQIEVKGNKTRRSKCKYVDYILYCRPNRPLAVIEAKDDGHEVADWIQQWIWYATDLDIPFVFSSNWEKFFEHDMITWEERLIELSEFPSPESLWQRYKNETWLTDEQEKIITTPYYFMDVDMTPRYYQRIAINRTVDAIAKWQKRLLLVMATGTWKTFTAFQIIHRLWKSRAVKRVLYLADRNILIDQTMRQDFKPFQKVMTKIENKKMDSSYEIYMSLYHQLSLNPDDVTYKQFKPDFFDLIIVDECHRSSAKDDSNWHEILNYFSSATQIGMTATPKETNDVSNIAYFWEPIYTYSLKQGIEDWYLAPYKVVKVELNTDLEWYTPRPWEVDEEWNELKKEYYSVKDYERTLVIDERVKVVAKRITEYMKANNRYAKTIVFCVDQEHALRMRIALAQENQDLMKEDSRYVMRITAWDKDWKDQLDNFIDINEKYPVIATTSKLLSTGVNTQTVELIVLDTEIGSMTEFKQIIWRWTRIVDKKNKHFFTIMDFRNNIDHFNDPEFDGKPVSVKKINWWKWEDLPEDTFKPEWIDDSDSNLDSGWIWNSWGDGVDLFWWGKGERVPFRKLHVNWVDVYVSKETVKFFDTDGSLKVESIKEYSTRNLQRLYSNYDIFAREWTSAENKKDFLRKLDSEWVWVDEIEDEVNDNNYDIFDILWNMAYHKLAIDKWKRIQNVLDSEVYKDTSDTQKQIIDTLLNTYRDKDVTELENLSVLNIKSFQEFGWLIPILKQFGWKDWYLETIQTIKNLLYVN